MSKKALIDEIHYLLSGAHREPERIIFHLVNGNDPEAVNRPVKGFNLVNYEKNNINT